MIDVQESKEYIIEYYSNGLQKSLKFDDPDEACFFAIGVRGRVFTFEVKRTVSYLGEIDLQPYEEKIHDLPL